MYKKWMRRRLPVVVFAVFIILYVDFQLRTGTSAPHERRSPAVQRLPHSSRPAQRAADTSGSSPASASASASGSGSPLKLEQVFIAVKTTGRFHGTRLALLLHTWISRTKAQVSSEATALKLTRACAAACAGTRRCFKSVSKQMSVIIIRFIRNNFRFLLEAQNL